MVSSRAILICITLFLAMVMTISSLPVVDKESETKEPIVDKELKTKKPIVDKEVMTNEHPKTSVDETMTPTSTIPEVITDNLLFADAKDVPIDENIRKGEVLLFKTDNDVPVTPSTDDPRSFQIIKLREEKSF
jgi:hypothetical protein